ncbi:hypothetical protein [Marinomonas communis]|uniref:hypothetical protein n=1 Tax=Marinomonas communis TaxID=28254 RepID=UPI001D18C019|nr:hypothetical protein [Marinomonas communis]MCC4276131.1 hypothetical protein [Marinomonas communis]
MKSEIERVNKLISLQNELIKFFELYQMYVENNYEKSYIDYAKEEIETLQKELKEIRVNRLTELFMKENII